MSTKFVLNETSYFGKGAREELSGEINKRGFKKVLVVTDKAGNTATSGIKTVRIDKTAPTGEFTISTDLTNQSSVTAYVTNVEDTGGSGIDNITVNSWYGEWIEQQYNQTATYDSANNRYYATANFAEMPDSTTGTTNNILSTNLSSILVKLYFFISFVNLSNNFL